MKLFSVAVLAALCVPVIGAEIGVVEEIIAKVNGDIITKTELERTRKQMDAEYRQRGVSGPNLAQELAKREKYILSERIDQLLLVQKGKELNINVDADVTKFIAGLQLESKIADPEKFQQFVREQSGQSYEDYRNDLKNSFLTRRVINQEVGSRITVPRAEVRKYYDEHKNEFMRKEEVFLREILVSTEGKDDKGIAAAEKKAKDLVARARKGERFPELARDNSDGTTARNGCELAWFKKGELDPKIEQIVFTQERGYVTDPIRVPNGFLVLKLDDRHKEGQAEFEAVENEVMERLYMPRMEPSVRTYLTKLRSEAFLEIKPGYEDAFAAPGKDTRWQDPAQLKPETVTKEEVQSKGRRKRFLGMMPVPGTSTSGGKPGSSKSK
jgi:parvulin-like peptidyl-prolyl isomerase